MTTHLIVIALLLTTSLTSLYMLNHASYVVARRWGSVLFVLGLLAWAALVLYVVWQSLLWALSQWSLTW